MLVNALTAVNRMEDAWGKGCYASAGNPACELCRTRATTSTAGLAILRSGFRGAQRANAKRGALNVDRDARKARHAQLRERRRRRYRNKRAANVPHAMQPAIANFQREKHSAWPQHAMEFLERGVLLLRRTQVMQHQHRSEEHTSELQSPYVISYAV